MSAEYMASYGIRSSKSWHNTKIVEKHLPKPGIVQRTFAIWALRVLNQGPSDLQSDALPTELFRLMNCIDCTTLCSTMRFKFYVFRYILKLHHHDRLFFLRSDFFFPSFVLLLFSNCAESYNGCNNDVT